MVKTWIGHILFYSIFLSLLTGCRSNQQPLLPADTEPSATPAIPVLPSSPVSIRPIFLNQLIYNTPEMYAVSIQTVEYPTITDPTVSLPMYIFYPPGQTPNTPIPVVILPNAWKQNGRWLNFNHTLGSLNNFEGWGRIIAANGMAAIAYETTSPNDIDAVINYLQLNSTKLGLDTSRIGLFAESFNSRLAGSYAYQENRNFVKFAVFYYGNPELPDSPNKTDWDAFCLDYDCYSTELPQIMQLRKDLPILVVRTGYDSQDNLADIDYFIQQAQEQGIPITLIKYDNASQRFEWNRWWAANNAQSKQIINQTVEFMQEYAFSQ
jgi:hypothetical protein